jgi:hypothetical protein
MHGRFLVQAFPIKASDYSTGQLVCFGTELWLSIIDDPNRCTGRSEMQSVRACGRPVWETLSLFEVGPTRRGSKSDRLLLLIG